MLAPLPGAISAKPGCATKPFFGVKPSIVDEEGHEVGPNQGGFLGIDQAWPGMMRSVHGDHDRFKEVCQTSSTGEEHVFDRAYAWIVAPRRTCHKSRVATSQGMEPAWMKMATSGSLEGQTMY